MQEITRAIKQASKDLFGVDVEPELTRPEEQFGDYSTNVAMQLAGKLDKNPRELAVAIASKLHGQNGIAEVNIAGPGFINLKLTDEALLELLSKKPNKTYEGQTVVAEYSDPNPFKVLHAGHLYTTLVGDVIARLLEEGGAKVIRINYGGDVGLHVARSMWGVVQDLGGELPEKLLDIAEGNRAKWLGERYVEGTRAYGEDENAKHQIVQMNKKIYQLHEQNDHTSPLAQIYWTCRDWSYKFFDQLYKELQVHEFDRYIPESEVTPLGVETVQEQLKKGVYEKSDGAVVFKGEKYGLHTRVFINSEGLPTYEAKDVGLMLVKWNDYHYDSSYYITGNEQAEYFKVMFKSVEQFEPEAAKRSRNLTNGMVKLAGGVKMSSRLGNVVGALDILNAAADANNKLTNKDNHETVLAAVKYAFLKNRLGADLVYEPKESVSLEGNSGPYLQYAHARARNILAKAEGMRMTVGNAPVHKQSLDKSERSLVRKIGEYAEVVDKATAELMPHHICTYLYELAQVFNRFYEQSRVIGDPRQELRLQLVQNYADVLKNGLELLGISAPDKM